MNHVTDPRSDRPLGRDLRDWLEGSVAELPDGAELPSAIRSDVLSRLPGTPQRRRWWPFRWRPFGTGATRSADREGPHPEGRPRSMFNAARVVVSVIVLALVGSLAYLAAPTVERTISPAAPAAIDPSDFAGFSGTFRATLCEGGERTIVDGGLILEGDLCSSMDLDVSDDRLSGDATGVHNAFNFHDGHGYGVRTLATEIANDGGSWSGTGIAFHDTDDDIMRYEFLLAGEGDYDGLSAMLSLTSDSSFLDHEAMGVIFPGELPPRPIREDVEMPAAWTGAIDAADYGGVDGTLLCAQGSYGTISDTQWGAVTEGETYDRCLLDVGDPRIDGNSHSVHDYHKYAGKPQWGVRASSDVISNEAGSWVGGGWGYQHPESGAMHYVDTYRGTGAYEGLSALQILSQGGFGLSFYSDGVIFPGELPPYPELPPAE